LHQFYRDGVHLLGKFAGFQDGELLLAPDLKESLNKSSQFEQIVTKRVDEFILKNHLELPEETLSVLRDGYDAPEAITLNL